MVGGSRLRVGLVLAALAAAVGCSSGPGSDTQTNDETGKKAGAPTEATDPAAVDDTLAERPWEVVSNKGETYLSNVFYAEPIDNEQIMPWVIDGRAVIDRLVYPTLGNPNLYVKDDAKDELVMVLRMEDDAIAHLAPKQAPAKGLAPTELALSQDDANQIAFLLVAKNARSAAEASSAQFARAGVYPIKPKKILINAEPDDMPSSLKQRHTIRFVFDQAAMASVPAGLYDARFEVRKGGQVYANVFEYQYNAVRVFDHESDEYTAINVTDTQVSVGVKFDTLTAAKLDDFVDAVNASSDPTVKNAAFITFNGDLHNGGAPGTILQNAVATTYNSEAKRILSSLKRLNLPIFLTPGNHDGYVGLGHVPDAVASFEKVLGTTLQKVVDLQNNRAWPGYSWDEYAAWLAKTPLDGVHKDIVAGAFQRTPAATFGASFTEVPRTDRNYILYDGFYQWQKTYGPLQESWTFGKNRYVSLNTFEVRQHRRNGWGMYTVNYGGAVSKEQMAWVDRELGRAKVRAEDVVMLMHHDPRGGHKGKDFGYYYPVLDYAGMGQSTVNYLLAEKLAPIVCKLDDAQLSVDDRDSCAHDGLQEWMAPEAEFDANGGVYMSGVELLKRVVGSPQVRTLLVGHAHLNSMEVLQPGDPLVPGRVSMDPASAQRLSWYEGANPMRNRAWATALATGAEDAPAATMLGIVAKQQVELDALLAAASPPAMRTLSNDVSSGPHELAVLRLTSNADLANQTYGSVSMFGWSVLHVNRQAGPTPKINRVTYLVHAGPDAFNDVETVDVDRTKSITAKAPDNRVAQLFSW